MGENGAQKIAFDLIDRIYRAAPEREEWMGFCGTSLEDMEGRQVAAVLISDPTLVG